MELDLSTVILGLIMPFFVALAKQSGLSKTVNSVIAIVVYVVAAALWMVYNQIPFTLDNIVLNATALTTIGLVAYKMFWDAIRGPSGDTPGGQVIGDGSIDAKITSATSISKFKAMRPVKPVIGRDEQFA